MANVLLGVTGSVAAIHTPLLFEELRQAGHEVKVVATHAALYFFDPAQVNPALGGRRNPDTLIMDEDEWPGRDHGRHYQRADQVLHIELRRWAEVLLIAPLDANTLAKLVCGLCDNCLTCVWRAWDRARPIVLAPAMNTLMWEHPFTFQHLKHLGESAGDRRMPSKKDLDGQITWINRYCPKLRIVAPISKRLACDDVGVGAMAEREQIVAMVHQVLEGK